MNKPDDFDLIPRNRPNAGQSSGTPPTQSSSGGQPPNWEPEPDNDPPPSRGNWGVVALLLGVALLAFGIGAALFTLRDRMNDLPTPTPGVALAPTLDANSALATLVAAATLAASDTGAITGTITDTNILLTPSRTVTATRPVTATPTLTPTPIVTPSPTPCALPVANGFQEAYRRENFGCPTTGAQVVWAAAEPFERGAMLWRSDTNKSYVFTLDGVWQMITAGWDGQSTATRGEPPPGRYTPERGFGWVWGTSDPVFNALGWATDIEKGFCAEAQDFEIGFYLQSVPVDSCTAENLYNQAAAGDWRPVYLAAHESGVWSGSLGGSTVASQAPTRAISVASRPETQGTYAASRTEAISIDGRFDDWSPTGWLPIVNVVQGWDDHDGPEDSVGAFQVAWNNQGLILALQVRDDRIRLGPDGTDLWQGDSIEIQFDANLADDYNDTSANGDDTQLGIGFVNDRGALFLYRWLPFESEGSLPVIAAGDVDQRGGNRGYSLETILPWSYIGVASPEAGRSYGFNVSINDNDSNRRAQQSVLSASPVRTTYNDPTQWGTLVLMP